MLEYSVSSCVSCLYTPLNFKGGGVANFGTPYRQTTIGLELQNSLSALDNKKIEEVFEADNNNQKFKFEKRFAEQHLDSLKKHETTFKEAVQSFSTVVNK